MVGKVRSDGYYRRYSGDYLRDTLSLSMTEDGAYNRLLDSYYSEERLPADQSELYRVARAMTEEERRAVDKVVKKYFTVVDNRLMQARVERELKVRREFREEQSRKGKLSAEVKRQKRSLKGGGNITGVGTGA